MNDTTTSADPVTLTDTAVAGTTLASSTSAIALTAATAGEYDFILALDASSSMAAPSKRFPGRSRWQEMQELAFGIATALAKFDSDGIDVIAFGATTPTLQEGVTPDALTTIFNTLAPYGSTPLDLALVEIVAKQARTKKNTVAIIFTDGEPNSPAAVQEVIVNAANAIEKDESLTLLFVQIGDDAAATAFLKHLDDDLQAVGAKFDIVDTLPAGEAETYSPIDLINHAIND